MSTPQVPVFVISRLFAASPERVYQAWADPEKTVQWSGPKGSQVQILRGTQAAGEHTLSRTSSAEGPEMFSLCKWLELKPASRITWEQSFCSQDGLKCAPPFFDDWPQTLLTEVVLEPQDGGTLLTLKWTPIEYDQNALTMFHDHMDSMKGGWGGSLDKLEAWLNT